MAGADKHIRLTFTKEERLKSKKKIDELFSVKLFIQNPILRIYYAEKEPGSGFPAQFAFAVPKKLFPLATDRNRVKRLLRESVRHFKPGLYKSLSEKNRSLLLLLSYQAKKIATYNEVDAAVISLLQKLTAK